MQTVGIFEMWPLKRELVLVVIETKTGPQCQLLHCPSFCNGHGFCAQGFCQCEPGFSGDACEDSSPTSIIVDIALSDAPSRASPLPALSVVTTLQQHTPSPSCAELSFCNNRGTCSVSLSPIPILSCECHAGFSGASCETTCPNQCSHAGRCIAGQCLCASGFLGEDCSIKTCCSGRGTCDQGPGFCDCFTGFTGETCELISEESNEQTNVTSDLSLLRLAESCSHRNNCNARGLCLNGECLCALDFHGPSCENKVRARDEDILDLNAETAADEILALHDSDTAKPSDELDDLESGLSS